MTKPDKKTPVKTVDQTDEPTRSVKPTTRMSYRLIRNMLITVGSGLLLASLYVGYLYASSPTSIREPLLEHYHFRMQVLVNGKAENFGQDKYQTGYAKDNCNVALPDHPIHFHDNRDQFVHIHWEGATGGQVLKYYGWNFIGGTGGSLGYRFDEAPKLTKLLVNVPIHGQVLPTIPDDANFYVYTGSSEKYQEKNFEDFTQQDLEIFFNKTSNFPAHKINQEKRGALNNAGSRLSQLLVAKAHADDGVGDNTSQSSHGAGGTHSVSSGNSGAGDTVELKRINNLLGDVIIFVQKDKPSDAQIKDRFTKLVPLGVSSCGG